MRILVSGASGLLGRAFVADARGRGQQAVALVRRPPRGPDEREWDPGRGVLEPAAVEGFDAVVHLAGAGIADARWTPARRREIRDSRLHSTALLARALAGAARPPAVLLSASAVGWYGDRGDAWLDESSGPGTGFLAELGRAWEAAAAPAAAAGIRVAHPRTGLVLARHGGALGRMLPLFRLGLGGPLGSGRQWWSWISIRDWVGSLQHACTHTAVRGPFNAVSPAPETCAAFARTLGRVLGRPAWLPAPAVALHAVLGRELADEVLLAGQRVRPGLLAATGFEFRDPHLEPALRALLARVPEPA